MEQVRVEMSFSQMFFIHDFLELQKSLVPIVFAVYFQVTNRLISFPNVSQRQAEITFYWHNFV